MTCIIIDDDETARIILEENVSINSDLQLLASFPTALESLKLINDTKLDIIFLDIHMPGLSGFDFIKTLICPPRIILTTSDKNFAIKAFEYECIVDYLLKPITPKRFEKSIKKLKETSRLGKPDSYYYMEKSINNKILFINIDRKLIKIEITSIKYIEAKGDYILIKTDTLNYTVHCTLKKIKKKLSDDLFIRVHRSYLINIDKIIDIEDNSILIGRDIIPLSRSKRVGLMEQLNLL